MGIDRLAMLKYGMPDLRDFFDADLRWLKHYGFRRLRVPTLGGGLGQPHEVHAFLAEGASRHNRERGRDRRTLTRIGLEVEEVFDPATALASFTVAQVLKAEKHPNADKLQVCEVDTERERAAGRVRRAECARGPEGRVRAGRQLRAGQRASL